MTVRAIERWNMSYTGHTWIRIFPVDDFPKTLLDDTLSILFAQTWADPDVTRETPLHIKIHKRYIDIQIGFKRMPRLENLWAYFGSRDYDFEQAEELMECELVHKFEEWETYNFVTEIWYRFGHGDGGIDYIGCFSTSDKWKIEIDIQLRQSCRYTFDKMIVKWHKLPQSKLIDTFDWTKKGKEWELSFEHEYWAFNSRFSEFWKNSRYKKQIRHVSPTTDIIGESSWDGWFYEFSKKNSDIAEIFIQNAVEILCYRNNRVVKIIRFNPEAEYKNDWFTEYNLDYWDNCINPEWLAYKQEIGLDE